MKVPSALTLTLPWSVAIVTPTAAALPLTAETTSKSFAPAGSLTRETRAFGVPLAVTTVGGVIPTGFTYPEGHVDVSGGGLFNGVYITSTAPNFAIDDVRIVGEAPTAIPEPSTVAMLGLGVVLLGLAQSCRRIVRTTRA